MSEMAGEHANLAVWRRDFRKDGEERTDEIEKPDWNTVSWARPHKDKTYSRSLLNERENKMQNICISFIWRRGTYIT
jgi:hypothetical protein